VAPPQIQHVIRESKQDSRADAYYSGEQGEQANVWKWRACGIPQKVLFIDPRIEGHRYAGKPED